MVSGPPCQCVNIMHFAVDQKRNNLFKLSKLISLSYITSLCVVHMSQLSFIFGLEILWEIGIIEFRKAYL